jgi:hypothetical protein
MNVVKLPPNVGMKGLRQLFAQCEANRKEIYMVAKEICEKNRQRQPSMQPTRDQPKTGTVTTLGPAPDVVRAENEGPGLSIAEILQPISDCELDYSIFDDESDVFDPFEVDF